MTGISLSDIKFPADTTEVLFDVTKNTVDFSGETGIEVIDSQVQLLENTVSECPNGITLVGLPPASDSTRNILINNTLSRCTIAGLVIAGEVKGSVILSNCVMKFNRNGIIIDQTSPETSTGGRNSEKSPPEGTILIENSKLDNNNNSGIEIRNLVSRVQFSETSIKTNTANAIYLFDKRFKNRLCFNMSLGTLSAQVNGNIGGPDFSFNVNDLYFKQNLLRNIKTSSEGNIGSKEKCLIF